MEAEQLHLNIEEGVRVKLQLSRTSMFSRQVRFPLRFQALAIKTADNAYFQEITHLLRFQFPPTVGFLPHLSFKNWGKATLDRAALRR